MVDPPAPDQTPFSARPSPAALRGRSGGEKAKARRRRADLRLTPRRGSRDSAPPGPKSSMPHRPGHRRGAGTARARLFPVPARGEPNGPRVIGRPGWRAPSRRLDSGRGADISSSPEADPSRNAPTRCWSKPGPGGAETVIVLDRPRHAPDRPFADIVLPVADWAEGAGNVVNHRAGAWAPLRRRLCARAQAAWRVVRGGWRRGLVERSTTILADMAQTAAPCAARTPARNATPAPPACAVARAGWRQAGRTAP